jgi:hypothetical protein
MEPRTSHVSLAIQKNSSKKVLQVTVELVQSESLVSNVGDFLHVSIGFCF